MRTCLVIALALCLGSGAAAADSPDIPDSDGFAVFRWLVSLVPGEDLRERLVGHGGSWEQAPVPCERPKVYLALDDEEETFALSIESRCRGQSHVAEFDGRWAEERPDRLVLIFAEPGGMDEELACPITPCGDGSGEDCIGCRPAPDLFFELREVRR